MTREETDWREGATRLTTTSGGDEAPPPTRVPALTILAHPDARRIGERLALPILALGRNLRLSRLEPVFRPPRSPGEAGRPLAERSISRRPILLAGGGEPGGVVVDVGETRTQVAADGEPMDGRRALSAAELERGVVLLVGRHVVLLLHRMTVPVAENVPRFGLVGESDAVVRLCQEIGRLATLDVPVLLCGETGTGKELVARALHDGGPRSAGPFVAVNMATLTPSLAAAELFGAARGAYTGADRRKSGFFESARGGTLFLDEIGETPVEVQAMLLRALENREIVAVGSVEATPVDVRVIAATDARLEEAIATGRFRAPLYHRLAGYAVQLPALRERRDDVARLLCFFLAEELAKLGESALDDGKRPWPPAEVVARLSRHDWPGNVRELRNVARRLAIAGREASERELGAQLDELFGESPGTTPAAETVPPPGPPSEGQPSYRQPYEISEEELLEALAAHGWRIKPAAAYLGVSRTSLYSMIDRSTKIRRASQLGAEELADCRRRHGGDVEAMAAELRVSSAGLRHRLRELALSGRRR